MIRWRSNVTPRRACKGLARKPLNSAAAFGCIRRLLHIYCGENPSSVYDFLFILFELSNRGLQDVWATATEAERGVWRNRLEAVQKVVSPFNRLLQNNVHSRMSQTPVFCDHLGAAGLLRLGVVI